ncbi:APC family permease [Frondihabitans australicus]|uniref:Amino acid transporter n=1 Tax=Frondihabitans australicus TaxID=386892 RepID=A0A495IMN3_9MICO|nr:APC family permease [Frondihabitans australicus]RKR76385.1 amino acid transporter [Frondihabitans australicus]
MSSTKAPTSALPDSGLKRQIGFIGLMWASAGSIIGSGWLFGPEKALDQAGPAAIISWGIGAIAILILALVHAELGGMYPISGGTARFPHLAFGGVAGASFGWFSWLQAVTVSPIEVTAMINYGSTYFPFAKGWLRKDETLTPPGIIAAIIIMLVFVAINFLSVRALANTNSAATWWKIGVPVFTILVLCIVGFHGSNFGAADGFAPEGVKGIISAIPNAGIVFALLGFEQADQLAGESMNPKRDIPRAVIGSVVIGLVIYLALQVAFIGAIPGDKLLHSWTATATQFAAGPFALIAIAAGLGWLAFILYVDAVISPGGTGLIYFTATSRVSFGLSKNGYFPRIFEATTKKGVPWFGLIIAWVFGCICFLPFPSWQSLVGLITSASVLMYAGAPLALGAFRKRLPDVERPFRLPGAMILSPLAFIVANLIILWTGWVTDVKLGACIVLGFIIIGLNRLFKGNSTPVHLNWRAAQWLFPYLVGMALIVYLSDWNPTGPNIFPFGIDILVTAVFSVIIYFWAVQTSLSTGEILVLVEETQVHAEEVEAAMPDVAA